MKKLKTLNDVFDVYEDDIFANIQSLNLEDTATASLLYFDRSANKPLNPFFTKMLDDKGKEYTMSKIGTMFDAKFGQNVERLVETYAYGYNPIHNVDEDTTETTEAESTRTDNLQASTTRTGSGSDITTRTPNLTRNETETIDEDESETRTPNLTRSTSETIDETDALTRNTQDATANATVTADTAIYAYNAQGTPTPASKATNTETRTDTHTGTETTDRDASNSKTEQETGNEQTAKTRDGNNSRTTTDTGTERTERTITDGGTDTTSNTGTQGNEQSGTMHRIRKGNIGVTSAQQLLNQEVEFRQKFILFELICNFLDELLTIPIYQ